MIATYPRLLRPMPLTLAFSSRLLLTERFSISDIGLSSTARAETIRIHETLVTALLKESFGYNHGGINE